MQRSSNSITTLAAALAKAQAVLVNPEKSLVGTIPGEGQGGSERSFRYASLASGLDIVRKTLGEHEIATVQTTAIDQSAGTVNLTTMLAHSSGEWIASDWPVCPVADTAVPHQMGAALTYARRYALFTLVGIAGEDDLDAPDLLTPTGPGLASEGATPSVRGQLNSSIKPSPNPSKAKTSPRVVLEPKVSAERRDQLVAQIAQIDSADDATLWAYCNMRVKDGLTKADALHVEEVFERRLAGFSSPQEGPSWGGNGSLPEAGSPIHEPAEVAAPNSCQAAAPPASADANSPSPTVRARPPRGARHPGNCRH